MITRQLLVTLRLVVMNAVCGYCMCNVCDCVYNYLQSDWPRQNRHKSLVHCVISDLGYHIYQWHLEILNTKAFVFSPLLMRLKYDHKWALSTNAHTLIQKTCNSFESRQVMDECWLRCFESVKSKVLSALSF